MERERATFGAGCFWGVEVTFRNVPGVVDAISGYSGGTTERPTYQEVCRHGTGHAEVVDVTFDPERVTYQQLLDVFFASHDPTQLNRQGPDVGSQYRSGIWYVDDAQKTAAEAFLAKVNDRLAFKGTRAVTQVESAKTFYPAEDYHQDYVVTTGRPCHVADPW